MALDEAEIRRYARHIVLPQVGGRGQERLLAARVLVVGAGGLGAPALLYLAAAGVGTIGIVDDDVTELSNLQRQIIHRADRLGEPKVASAAAAIAALNPTIRVVQHRERLDRDNAARLIEPYELVLDGSDGFETRYTLNDACHRLGRTLISAAILQFDGQLTTFKPHLGAPHPCYRCLFPVAPSAEVAPTCASAGVIGALGGMLGSMQALEAVKELLGIGDGLSGRLLMIDALAGETRETRFKRSPTCPLCAAHG